MRILLKYFEYRNLQLLLVGLVWIGLSTPWFPDSINFIWLIFFSNTIPLIVNLLVGNLFIPIVGILWVKAFTDLIYNKSQKLLILIFVFIGVIYEILFFIFLFLNPSLIGSFPTSHFQMVYSPGFEIVLLIYIAIFLVTGILFGRESLKSDNSEIRLKGKFLLIAFISFTVGAILDSLLLRTPLFVIITRLILISAAIEFYFGFIPPDWLKKF
ncbi:MAG: hypothetical protein P8Y97_12715, partial [Candidatus Lokiarchaeota archaeon]